MCKPKGDGGMGFWDLEAFNFALFAKQGWCLLNHLNSLVAKVLNGTYHTHAKFFEAKVPNNSSFVWHSIAEARELLMQGIRWRVGNGNNIMVSKDAYLGALFNFKIITKNSILAHSMRVADLIDQETRVWKLSVLDSLFLPTNKEEILKIPIYLTPKLDVRIWHYTLSGEFS